MICASVPERPRGRDHAARQPFGIAVAHHHGQRNQPHGEHRGGDHTGGRREQGADKDHRVGDPAANRAEQLPDGIEQVLGHAAALEDEPHEREERNREEGRVRHDAEHTLGQRLEKRGVKQAQLHADHTEEQAVRRKRKRDRVTDQQKHHQAAKHQRRHQLQGHQPTPPLCSTGYGMSPFRKAILLMTSDAPWSASKAKPTGMSSLIGHRMSPPGSEECSPICQEFKSDGQLYQPIITTAGSSMNNPPKISIHACARCESFPAMTSMRTWSLRAMRELSRYDVDAHMVVALERPRGDQQEHDGVEVPLDLEPGIRAHVDGVAEYRVHRADDHGQQTEPGGDLADALVHGVDHRGKAQQRVHEIFVLVLGGPSLSKPFPKRN